MAKKPIPKGAIIFDVYGTLTRRSFPEWRIIRHWKLEPTIFPALQRAVCGQKFKNWERYLDRVIAVAGIPNIKKNRDLVRSITEEGRKRSVKSVFLSARKVLSDLKQKGWVLGIVTDANPGSREIITKNGLARFFKQSATIFSYEVGLTKQDPRIFQLCLKKLGVPAENVVIVGDRLSSDIMMARRASKGEIKGILISKNPSREAREAGCLIVPSLAGVPKAIEKIEALSKPRKTKRKRPLKRIQKPKRRPLRKGIKKPIRRR